MNRTRSVLFLVVAALAFRVADGDEISYSRQVRPILSARCFKCHGPDEENRASGLRLDVREAATGEAESGLRAIAPGKVNESEFVRRIESQDESEVMPPPETNHKLTSEQISILKRWVAQGAVYEQHWSFIAPQEPQLPVVKSADWPRNAIDYFVLARLEANGLRPSPEADRTTLVRRLYLDLVGIPPTPEEADAFLSDSSPDAYEKLVERLLASPHYGERWARRWLDLARYADTNGFQIDFPRSVWPYRDWVINALNADMPFDQFTIEQIAGDMLPDATVNQRIATGFHRNTMINEEGGIDPQEFRYLAMVDRVNTTGTVWLGLTIGCAQCHTHKFDPIQHTEYFKLMAWLNNTEEPILEIPEPSIVARRAEIQSQIDALENSLADRFPLPAEKEPDHKVNKATVAKTSKVAKIAESDAADEENLDEEADEEAADTHAENDADKEITASEITDSQTETSKLRRNHAEAAFQKWLAAQRESAVTWSVLRPTDHKANLPILTPLEDGSVLASGDQTNGDRYELTFPQGQNPITHIRLEVLTHDSLPNSGPGRVHYGRKKGDKIGDFFLSEFELYDGDRKLALVDASDSKYLTDRKARYQISKSLDGLMHSGWKVHDGVGKDHQAVFRLTQPIKNLSQLKLVMKFESFHYAGIGRFRISVANESRPVTAKTMPGDLEQFCLLPPKKITTDQHDRLWNHFLQIAPELARARSRIEALRKTLPALPSTFVMEERHGIPARPTYRHHRGEYLQPKEEVQPGVLSVLHQPPSDAPLNRLTFARWLVDPKNPLVGRVMMNRQWAAIFGRGIVNTTEDFGHQGELPSHPQLLDWLAIQWVKQGWSMKAMHRLMVTSATYRQASQAAADHLASDSDNRLLSRGPRVRLEAELIRDQLLAISGLLSRKLGGPSVFPPQPAAVVSEGTMATHSGFIWKASAGKDRYRRSLYTFAKRTAPFAMLQTFDGPSGQVCVARRDVSNSPLQALTLLNDQMFFEVAQALGRQMVDLPGTLEERMRKLFRRCLIRDPRESELRALVAFYELQRKHYSQPAAKADAEAVIGQPIAQLAEGAAWTLTARALLNLDEIVNKE